VRQPSLAIQAKAARRSGKPRKRAVATGEANALSERSESKDLLAGYEMNTIFGRLTPSSRLELAVPRAQGVELGLHLRNPLELNL
jgi:hypothetical protein